MKKYVRIISLLLAVFMLFSFAGCSKDTGELSGEWINEREYYEQDENGNWILVTDQSVIDSLGGEFTGIDEDGDGEPDAEGDKTDKTDKTDTASKGDATVKPTGTASKNNGSNKKLDVVTDYCGNNGWDIVYEQKNMHIESEFADVLQDDYRMRRYIDGEGWLTYKANGVEEVVVQYSYAVGDRYAPEIVVSVSKDAKNWTEVKTDDVLYTPYNGDSWTRQTAYYGNIDSSNQYVRIYIPAGGKFFYDPNINFVQINGITEKLLGELGGYGTGVSAAKTIYIDSVNGNDKNDGTSEKKALKTLYAASQKTYAPGSKLLLKAGCTFSGSLTFYGSGTAKAPITISSYGKGAKPVINARGGAALTASGEYITIEGIKIVNKTGTKGISYAISKPGATKGVTIKNCDFENININFTGTNHANAGIHLNAQGREPCWFDGAVIENNTFNNVARCGIVIGTDWCNRKSDQEWGNKNDLSKKEYFPHVNVKVRNNTLNKIGGDGILLFGCKGGLVEKNTVSNSALFKDVGEIHWVSIWCYACTDSVFQYNEVYGNSGKNSGYDLQAFDADISNIGCIFQYNYSHDNEGGAMLFCTNDASLGCATENCIFRYNLSVNDGFGDTNKPAALVDITSSCYNSQIYNNTFYVGKNTKLVNFANYDGGPNDSKNSTFKNNIFYVANGVNATYGYDRLASATFENNIFYNSHEPMDSRIINKNNKVGLDPQLTSPGATGNGLEAIAKKYLPKSGSPALTQGIAVSGNGGKDLLGKSISDTLIGALMK